ncbi:MAG: hypothetical protein AABX48_00150 [Nanoarchaeota archaeon]
MNLLRHGIDHGYNLLRDSVFRATVANPEKAHEYFIKFTNAVYDLGMDKFLLNNSANGLNPPYKISNAAGFNKNGDIPPSFMEWLGFDRVVVGTVTGDPWVGNDCMPRIWRFPKTSSMVNYLGLPGVGAEAVAENLSRYKHNIPLTISVMSTPGKKGIASVNDIIKTVRINKDISNIDIFQYNDSCPNTHEAEDMLNSHLEAICNEKHPSQKLEAKISPDLTKEELERKIEIFRRYSINAIVISNTTKYHNPRYIIISPRVNVQQVGGASGAAVYEPSFTMQNMVDAKLNEIKSEIELIAVGGIDSVEKAKERTRSPRVKGIEIFTGLIFKGPGLIEELREA